MKQKKQIKIIISLLVMIAVLMGGWGLLRTNGLKAEETKEEKDTTSTMSSTTLLPIADDWLPTYNPNKGINGGGWLDSLESYIPAESSFVMKYLPGRTMIGNKVGIDYSEGVTIPESNGEFVPGYVYFSTKEPDKVKWVKVRNVGFYDGKPVDVKVIFKVAKAGRDDAGRRAYLDLNDSASFMTCSMDAISRQMDVTYEFSTSEGSLLNNLSLYWDFYVNKDGHVVVPSDILRNIYSVSEEYTLNGIKLPISLKYNVNTNSKDFELFGTLMWNSPQITNYDRIVAKATSVFKLATGIFSVTFVSDIDQSVPQSLLGSQVITYSYSTFTKVQYPSPMNMSNSYSEIIASDAGISLSGSQDKRVTDLNYGFIQQVPWETKNEKLKIDNRTQKPSWLLTPNDDEELDTFDVGAWKVVPQDLVEADYTNKFDFSAMNGEEGTLAPTVEALESDDFYSHYYLFNQGLEINYDQPIKKSNLTTDSTMGDGYYVNYSGEVTLKVEDTKATNEQQGMYNPNGETANYDSSINFYAPIEYKYIDSVTKAEIPASSRPTTATATGDGIVTWDAPLTPMSFDDYEDDGTIPDGKKKAPAIPGYRFASVTFNGDSVSSESLAQVQVTKLLKDGGDPTKAEDYTQNNVVTLEYQPVYTVDVQVGALDKDGNFGMIPFAPLAPPSETSDPYVTVLETTAPTMPEPENAISPTDPGADAEFTFPTTYDFEVGTGKSYKVTQMENVNNDYTKPNQATSPVFSINNQNQLVVDGKVVSNSTYQGEDFILSWDATNKKLTIQIINQPNGEYQLVSVEPLEYGKVSLPQKNPNELIKRQDANWKVQFTDTRLDAYRTPLKLSVILDQNFTNTNDPSKTISGILLYRPEEATPITPDDFLIEGEEIPIKEKINPNSGTNDIDWPEQAGFLLQIDDEKQTKIFAGDYQAELTFILSEDPL